MNINDAALNDDDVDDGHSFDAVLMYGHELTWIVFEVLLFAIIDLAFYNYFLDGAITYIVMEVSTQSTWNN